MTMAIAEKDSGTKRPRLDDSVSAKVAAGLPSLETLTYTSTDIEDIWKQHESACAAGKDFYKDPESGYHVFTRIGHEKRGKCCGSGCRHCPYDYENVRDDRLANRVQQPAFLHVGANERARAEVKDTDGTDRGVVLLFWSTGKDSFLTLRALVKEGREVILVTTFDAKTRVIANQEVHISDAARQAKHLDVSLVGIPLHPGVEYVERLQAGLQVLRKRRNIASLAFGDLHLEHIRSWREDKLRSAEIGVDDLIYPLWQVPYATLQADLESSGVTCTVSALGLRTSAKGKLNIGAVFNKDLSEELSEYGIDAFGENGEFHTLAQVWTVSCAQALGITT